MCDTASTWNVVLRPAIVERMAIGKTVRQSSRSAPAQHLLKGNGAMNAAFSIQDRRLP